MSSGGSGNVTVMDALQRLETASSREVKDALADLRHILKHNRGSTSLGINDKSYHKIFETLFDVVRGERSTYLKYVESGSKTLSAVTTRLMAATQTLRVAVDVSVQHIRYKSVRALIDHITETSLDSNGQCIDPLIMDYSRCLSTILAHAPHAEHLKPDQWRKVCDFCLDRIASNLPPPAPDMSFAASAAASIRSSAKSSRIQNATSRVSGKAGSTLHKSAVDEFVAALRDLTAVSTSPLVRQAEVLLSTMLAYVATSQSSGQSQVNALRIINHTLVRSRSENVELTKKFVEELVRTARALWTSRMISVKDEILIMLVLLHAFLERGASRSNSDALTFEMRELGDVIRNEYGRRDTKDQLHLDDLVLELDPPTEALSDLRFEVFGLRERPPTGGNNVSAEHNWTLMRLLALLSLPKDEQDTDSDHLHTSTTKRVRLSHWSDEILRMLRDPSIASKICAIQLISMMSQSAVFRPDILHQLAERLATFVSDDNSLVASWAMIGLSSVAMQQRSSAEALQKLWAQVWMLACRVVNSGPTCRASCHLLHVLMRLDLVNRSVILNSCDTMISAIEVNGPPLLCDSVSSFLSTVMLRLQNENVLSFKSSAERILTWLFRAWTPSAFHDRLFASQNVTIKASHVLNLIDVCLGRPVHHKGSDAFPVWGEIAQAWILKAEQQELLQYLLLTEDDQSPEVHHTCRLKLPTDSGATPNTSYALLVLGLCASEINRAIEQWEHAKIQRNASLNTDMIGVISVILVVGLCLSGCYTYQDTHRVSQLRSASQKLLDSLGKELLAQDCERGKVDAFLEVVANQVPLPTSEEKPRECIHELKCLLNMSDLVSGLFQSKGQDMQPNKALLDEDFMDVDSTPGSQSQSTGTGDRWSSCPRGLLTSTHDLQARTACLALYMKLLVGSTDDQYLDNSNQEHFVLGYLQTLTNDELLACRPVLGSVSRFGFQLDEAALYGILDVIAGGPLTTYGHERAESMFALVLDVMIAHVDMWVYATDGDLDDLCLRIYEFFTSTWIENGVLSTAIQKRLSGLLFRMLKRNADYGHAQGCPSVRTILFRILKDGNLDVQHFLAQRLPLIFGLYTFSMHEAIFEDLSANLPKDLDWPEGIAMRTLILAYIASDWHSLLRLCVYGIFETAGRVSGTVAYAACCIARLARSLKLENSQKLCKLFAPQLFFTWLEKSPPQDIPFAIFGYPALVDLIEDNMIELYAQLVVRNKDQDIQWLVLSLRTTEERLQRTSFAKAVAYAISWDVDMNTSCEARLKKHPVGSYFSSIQQKLPYIVAEMFVHVKDETALKPSDKPTRYQYAIDALQEMKDFSCSERKLIATQEPIFKGRFITDRLERLCIRAFRTKETSTPQVVDISQAFDQSSLTVILRSILDVVHPALGPAHAWQILRKLRLLVALAGRNICDGYPLEMLIRTLRPLVTDAHCADDAIGLLHYLLKHGKPFLKSNVSTLCSMTLVILLSMRSFMIVKQDNNTQESQFRATVSKMQSFYGWMTTYLSECMDVFQSDKDAGRKGRFQSLIQACQTLALPGSADRAHPSSAFLRVLLDDEGSMDPLLANADRKQVMLLLSHRFVKPCSASEDIFGTEELSIAYAQHVFDSTKGLQEAGEYEVWTAKVMGRAFASTITTEVARSPGRLPPEFLRDYHEPVDSQLAIAAWLQDVLTSTQPSHVGMAEKALREIHRRFADADDVDRAVAFETLLSSHVATAMSVAYETKSEISLLGRSTLTTKALRDDLTRAVNTVPSRSGQSWIQDLTIAVCRWAGSDPIVGSLQDLVRAITGTAEGLFPFIIHLALVSELEKEQVISSILAEAINKHFADTGLVDHPVLRLLIDTTLFLLSQPLPNEKTRMDRVRWLEIDYLSAAEAAARCHMPKAALYLSEIAVQPVTTDGRSTRRSSVSSSNKLPSNELLLTIYRSIDEPDSFYGVERAPSLQSVLERANHEHDGLKGIMLHTARMDASLRLSGHADSKDEFGVFRSMGAMNLNSLTHGLLNLPKGAESDRMTTSTRLDSARKLQQWDITLPQDAEDSTSILYGVLKSLALTYDLGNFNIGLENALRKTLRKLQDTQMNTSSMRSNLTALAVLTEIDELVAVRSITDLSGTWDLMLSRQTRWDIGRFNNAQQIVSYRETLFSVLSQNSHLREALHVSARDCREFEARSVINSAQFARRNDMIQQSLTAATYLSELVPICRNVGLSIDVAARFEAASILWRQGEISSSVAMLKELQGRSDLNEQTVSIGRAGLLAQLGHEVAAARLEKPDEVVAQYLKPAIAQLAPGAKGFEAGKVYHEFASFCDQQLQSPSNIEDFQRLTKIRDRRRDELAEYEVLMKDPKEKKNLRSAVSRARNWYTLDDAEYQKAKSSRDEFVKQSLCNYLLSFQACDDHNASVVRFLALWLENSDSKPANDAVKQPLSSVPSWKFVGLMNQLASRLQKDGTEFQSLLSMLIGRMLRDHPHHTVHHIFAACRTSTKDDIAKMRTNAAKELAKALFNEPGVSSRAKGAYYSDDAYNKVALQRPEQPRNGRMKLKDIPYAVDMQKTIKERPVPPITLNLELRPSADYADVPVITRFREEVRIAGGLSAPKIIIAVATDGKEYRQLFKGGNDDLRQDAIMEQVFGEVSKMLQNHKATRQRKIHVRTYKVVPLSSATGVIEFVPNSMPLADFLHPAHQKYNPKDIKPDVARKEIQGADKLTKDARCKTYKDVISRFQPVMRHFFFERFLDPDEWFERRLAYTRSTAAISMLGHVLGLGDRHTHNILLDEKSGEVIHIDLGVAFEAGRVLPIPEVVPFRMTRDIVDGMGVTKTEGVFRRCCEFTMEALREEKDGIMTLLNVLRYDPLYSWTLSPLRAKRMQEAQEDMETAGVSSKKDDEAGEAEQALSVVEKKLSKTLSVAATVNELIQQATDERNLAVLFAGWGAYF